MNIPEIKLILDPQSNEAKKIIGFKWANEPDDPIKIGERSKIGGKPDWIQDDETPLCPCNKKMTFYAQLDSIGDDIILGDCGMIYIFVCLECLETKSVIQCY